MDPIRRWPKKVKKLGSRPPWKRPSRVDEDISKLTKKLDRLWSEKLDEKIHKQVQKAVRYVLGEGRKGEFFCGMGSREEGRENSSLPPT